MKSWNGWNSLLHLWLWKSDGDTWKWLHRQLMKLLSLQKTDCSGIMSSLFIQFSATLTQHEYKERINFTIMNLHRHFFIIHYAFQVYTAQENAWKTHHEYKHLFLCSYKVYYNLLIWMFLLISCCSLLPVNIHFGTGFSEVFQNLTS